MREIHTKSHHLLLVTALVAVLLAASEAIMLYVTAQPLGNVSAPTSVTSQTEPEPEAHTVTFAAMGDMLAHEPVDNSAKTVNGYDFAPYFDDIKPLFASADVTFCNPETLVSGDKYGVSGYPQFNAPSAFARDLSGVGCNLINYATNHIADHGQAALNTSLDIWGKLNPLAIAGANRSQTEQDTVRYFTKNGITFAFLAFADFSNLGLPHPYSVNIYHNTALVKKLMKEAQAHADVVLVSMHWGTEDATWVNDDQREAARLVADLGADVIIGTGPHVLQSVDKLSRSDGGTTLVWYSIGNVLSTQRYVNELTGGVAKWTVTKTDGEIAVSDVAFDATYMSYSYTPLEDGNKSVHKGTLHLQPLADAGTGVAKWHTTIAERTKFVHAQLGKLSGLTITP